MGLKLPFILSNGTLERNYAGVTINDYIRSSFNRLSIMEKKYCVKYFKKDIIVIDAMKPFIKPKDLEKMINELMSASIMFAMCVRFEINYREIISYTDKIKELKTKTFELFMDVLKESGEYRSKLVITNFKIIKGNINSSDSSPVISNIVTTGEVSRTLKHTIKFINEQFPNKVSLMSLIKYKLSRR